MARQETISPVERDYSLEKSYRIHTDHPDQTVPAFVSANRDALAVEFFEWCQSSPDSDMGEQLRFWEAMKFGRELEPSAHGMMAHAVKGMLDKGPGLYDPQWSSGAERRAYETAVVTMEAPKPTEGLQSILERINADAGVVLKDVIVKPWPGDASQSDLKERESPRPDQLPSQSDLKEREPGCDDDDDWLEDGGL